MRKLRTSQSNHALLNVKLRELEQGVLLKETSNYGFDLGNVIVILESPEQEVVDFFYKNAVPFHESKIKIKVMENQKVFLKTFHLRYSGQVPYVMNMRKCK